MKFLGQAFVNSCAIVTFAWLGTGSGSALAQTSARPQVAVTGGAIAGEVSPDGDALIFRGIPFAAPPVGELRWRAPQPVVPWQGVRDAMKPAPACLQNDQRWNHADYVFSSEDCLTLDIRTASLTGKRPVMVWIHGGSNKAGSGNDVINAHVTDKGVVIVAIQYRLAVFGFLAPREAAAEAGGHAGNYGLMDQIAALRWVHDNIARFGGDPANVTIFGESAGSEDVSLLLAAPSARGLFSRAIMESGTPSFGMPPRSEADAFAIADQLGQILGTGTSLEKLRHASPKALLDADLKLTDDPVASNSAIWLRATVDGAVLPDTPRKLLAEAPAVPVIVGTNRVEFGPAENSISIAQMVRKVFGDNAGHALALYDFDSKKRDPRLGYPVLEMATDQTFRCPANNLATLLASHGWPVWRYQFDLAPGGALTHHAAEIPYMMQPIRFGDGVSLLDYWTNLAKTGDPNGAGSPAWPRWTPDARRYVLFDKHGVTAKANLKGAICALMPAEF